MRVWQIFGVDEERAAEITLEIYKTLNEVEEEGEFIERLLENSEIDREEAYRLYLAGRVMILSNPSMLPVYTKGLMNEFKVSKIFNFNECAKKYIMAVWNLPEEFYEEESPEVR